MAPVFRRSSSQNQRSGRLKHLSGESISGTAIALLNEAAADIAKRR
jgi:hypothetical protein